MFSLCWTKVRFSTTPGMKTEMDKLVTIARLNHESRADLCRLKLEEHGIKVFIADGGIVRMTWFLAGAVGGIKVQVAESDAATATAIIRQLEFVSDDDYDSPYKKADFWKCTNCGERVDGHFEICWNCQHSAPDVKA